MEKRKKLALVVAVAVIVVVVVAIAVVNPFAPRYGATLNVVVYGNSGVSYSVFVNGHQIIKEATIVSYASVHTLNITWKGNATHLCIVDVYSQGKKYSEPAWLTDNATARVNIRLS